MSDPLLLIDASHPRIATLTLNRADRRNALSVDLIEALTRAVQDAASLSGRRAIILRGAGPAFCAGLDFREAQDAGQSHRSAEALAALYRTVCASPLVTIAAAHGAVFGGGAGLIAACDLAVACDDLQLGYREVRRGLVAALVTCLLRRQVAGRRLREIVLLGQTLTATEALAAGLVNRVTSAATLMDEAIRLAETASEGAPGAISRTKRLLDQLDGLETDFTAALEVHLQAREAAEASEGIAAFFEKRKPRWSQ
jgi:methylglutaconyl-CoA hydratase